MEIIATFIQPSGDPLLAIFRSLLLLALVGAWVRGAQVARALRPRAVGLRLPGVISLGAIPMFATAVPGPTGPREIGPVREVESSPALDERVPPPLSLVRAGDAPPAVHPAIHTRAVSRGTRPLFMREVGPARTQLSSLEPWERGAMDLRRTSPRGSRGSWTQVGHYTVLPGDTLWDIAGKVLNTDDQRRIARYWPKLHRENRDVIGKDPNVLRPGQVLSLPKDGR